MSQTSRPILRAQIFRPNEFDRELIERARKVVQFAREVLAESDPTVLLKGYRPMLPQNASEAATFREDQRPSNP